ncbi:MAG TPA: multidrug DMT transporter permease [Bryobacteraceae bacterium]
MILPETYISALLLAILSMVCWGSWANTQKLTGKWRFELFYWDYALGVLLAVTLAAFTFGSMGSEGFSFLDSFLVAGKKNIAFGLAGGVVFNLANILLVAAIAVAGMSVAFPVGIGMALIIGVIWNYIIKPQGNPVMLFTGVALVLIAIVLDAMAYAALSAAKSREQIKAGKTRSTKVKTSWKGILLSVGSGILMGTFYPLVEMGKAEGAGLGPYAIGFVFAVGIFLSTFPFNLFFMNLPVEGEPLEVLDYFRGNRKQHLLGILGGSIWAVGTLSNFVVSSAARPASALQPEAAPVPLLGPAISYALGQGATLISALWGVLVWKEFRGAGGHVRMLLTLMFVLFAAGLALISVAALY